MAIYEARVIDNSTFASEGYIKVRVKEYSYNTRNLNGYMIDEMGDLSDTDYSSELLGENWIYKEKKDGEDVIKYVDSNAYVYSPFGGGKDYGVFYLPQPNSYGIVSTLGRDSSKYDDNSKYIWLGTLYTGDNRKSNFKNTPSPDNVDDYPIENKEFKEDYNNIDESFIIKTRSTMMDPTNPNASYLDWKKRPIENLIVLDRDKINIVHNIIGNLDTDENDNEIKGTGEIIGNTTIVLDSNGVSCEYDLEQKVDDNDEQEQRNTIFKIDEYGHLTYKQTYPSNSESKSVSIETSDSDITMEVLNGDNYSDFHLTSTQAEMSGPSSKFLLDTSQENPVLTIDAGDGTVNVNAKVVSLAQSGSEESYGVMLGVPGTTISNSFGQQFTASDRIFG